MTPKAQLEAALWMLRYELTQFYAAAEAQQHAGCMQSARKAIAACDAALDAVREVTL